MTTEEIKKCGNELVLVAEERLHFVFAESATSRMMKLYRSKNACLVDPESGASTVPTETFVLENPRLKVYPRILGKNTLADLDVSTHHRTGVLSDDSGRTWKLWAFTDKPSLTREVGEFASFVSKRALDDAISDYEHGVLRCPPVDLSDENLYAVRTEALDAGTFGLDPDYEWSEERFAEADVKDHQGYFEHAVLMDVAHLQRTLKRSTRAYPNFIMFISEWFRRCPKVWVAGGGNHRTASSDTT